MELPPFDALAPNYPVDTDPEAVKAAIGGQVNDDIVTNTFVVRISKAFNYAGDSYHIPRTDGGLFTLRGADGLSYALRVHEFIEFLRARYGPPDIVALLENNTISSAPFTGSRGIIT
ncbi:MAG: T6SS effector amidase Tae4 family protein, partial [Pseudomonadota bacterium]